MRFVFALLLLSSTALAQEAAITSKPEFNDNEEKFMLQACQAAEWSSRMQFTGFCDFLKGRFEKFRVKPEAPK